MNEPLLLPLSYETRNLEIPCYALAKLPTTAHEAKLLAAELLAESTRNGRFFVQAKCAMAEFDCLHLLEGVGFRFIETALVPTCILGRSMALREFKDNPGAVIPARHHSTEISFFAMEKNDETLGAIIRSIASESFTRDRFHLDPHCSDSAADRRYCNWVDDLLTDHAVTFHLLKYQDDVAGFMAQRREHLVLAGFSKRYTGSGFGDFLWLSTLKAMQAEGLKQAHTQISACNTAVLNLYVRLGFKFRDPLFILHYWCSESTALNSESDPVLPG